MNWGGTIFYSKNQMQMNLCVSVCHCFFEIKIGKKAVVVFMFRRPELSGHLVKINLRQTILLPCVSKWRMLKTFCGIVVI
jgi:hypothetical protein